MKFLCANRIAPDGRPHSAASHLGLYCLPMSEPAPIAQVVERPLRDRKVAGSILGRAIPKA